MAMYLQGPRAKVWLFCLKYLQGERGRLSFNITREICEYLSGSLLAQVASTFLRFFNCDTSAWGPVVSLKSSIQANVGSTWVLLGNGSLFCSGGKESNSQADALSESWKVAYILGADGTVEALPNMFTSRCFHGVIQVRDLYVFGGSKI